VEQIPDINLLKAIVAAAGGSVTLSNEIYQTYLAMDLDEFILDFEDDGSDTVMVLRYKTNEDN
jgi:hypothetical protein